MISTTDLTRELLYQIRLGEDSAYEFKRIALRHGKLHEPNPNSLADELAAFANASGGWLVCGVDDHRQVVGVDLAELDALDEALANIAAQSIHPPLGIETRHLELPDSAGVQRAVIAVRIAKSVFVHESPGGYFQRIASTKRRMRPELLSRLFQQRSLTRLIRFDETPVPNAPLTQIDLALVARFHNDATPAIEALRKFDVDGDRDGVDRFINANPPPLATLRKLYLVGETDGGASVLTVCGALLLLARPADVLPSATLQCVAYRGETRDAEQQIDAVEADGPIDDQVATAFAFVKRNMRVEAVKRPGRIDIPQFAERAVYEAIVNAVVHRDYGMHGARVRLHLFADRLELASPGGLPNTLSVDTLDANSIARNETLVNLVSRYYVADGVSGRQYLMERRGEGVPTILDLSQALSTRRPRYENFADTEVKLTIWAASRERNGLVPASTAEEDDEPHS